MYVSGRLFYCRGKSQWLTFEQVATTTTTTTTNNNNNRNFQAIHEAMFST
jgi:hypothetical protein